MVLPPVSISSIDGDVEGAAGGSASAKALDTLAPITVMASFVAMAQKVLVPGYGQVHWHA